jgi:nitric oxide dioxygenase
MPEHDRAWLARQIVDTSPDGIIFADTEGVVQLWSPGAERIFGFGAEEVIGRTMDMIIPERLRQRHWDAYHAAMARDSTRYGASDLLAVPALRKDGARISIEFTISLLHDESGKLLGPAAVVRDVTAKFNETNQLRKRLAELEAAQKPAAGEGQR